MKTAIIGLPMVGKTSLFTILTGAHQETRIGSTAVHVGVAKVPDARLEELAKLFEPKKVTHASVEYVDLSLIHIWCEYFSDSAQSPRRSAATVRFS